MGQGGARALGVPRHHCSIRTESDQGPSPSAHDALSKMASPKRLMYSSVGGGGARRGSGALPPMVVLVFLFIVAPSTFFVVRSGSNVHVTFGENLVSYMGKQRSITQLRHTTSDEGATTHHAAPLEDVGLHSSKVGVQELQEKNPKENQHPTMCFSSLELAMLILGVFYS
ncbi:uncharacterized protein [Triticum aestivum]|uniref:uncharacterized protein n=1 Tax=Triticum aestivum TaxID=4565 RepID=UPI001D033F7E|nr:uncharacterized protein LOC123111674 [Triticum aestivum]